MPQNRPSMKRARWQQLVGGPGLLIDDGSPREDWPLFAYIRRRKRRGKLIDEFVIVGWDDHCIGTAWSLVDAKRRLIELAKVTEVVE